MLDGQLKKIDSADELQPGMIVREVHDDGTIPPFADAVVLKRVKPPFQKATGTPDSFLIARPYCFGSSLGTTCPSPLHGCDKFEVSLSGLQRCYRLVLDSRGKPFEYKASP